MKATAVRLKGRESRRGPLEDRRGFAEVGLFKNDLGDPRVTNGLFFPDTMPMQVS